MAADLDDIASRVVSLEKRVSMVIDHSAQLMSDFTDETKDTRTGLADLKKQAVDPKEIADLKARVKELEAKLAKMKK